MDEGLNYLMSGNLFELETLECASAKITYEGTRCFGETTCVKLTHLNLSGNEISDEGLKNVALLSSLKSLYLNFEVKSQKAMDHLCKGKLENLTAFSLENSNLSDQAIEYLCKSANFKLSNLSLRENKITNAGAEMIAKYMCEFLKKINLSYNYIDALGILPLLSMDKIEEITIEQKSNSNHNILSTDLFPVSKVTHFSAANISVNDIISLILNDNLRTLKAQRANLSTESIQLISSTNQLTCLDVSFNNLSDANIKTIASQLVHLTSLNVSNNALTHQAAEYISTGSLLNLKTLFLRNNQIGKEGAKSLFLGNTTNLDMLYLCSNQIGEGITFLNNTTLKHLKALFLRDNQIGKYLKEVSLSSSLPYLIVLTLENNNLGTEEFSTLSEQAFPLLSVLDCSNNNITSVDSLIGTIEANFPKLKHFYIHSNPLSQKSKEKSLKLKSRLSILN